jgi:hypothetical protein
MNKKALFIGAIFLTVAITIIIPAAATAGPKEEAEPAQVTLIGITTTLGRTQALLRVKWPARVSNREASYMLSEGQLRRTVRLQMSTEFIPSGRIDFTSAEVPQVLQIYRALVGVELVTDSRVRTVHCHITLQAKADAPAQGAKLLEKALLEQAGVVITRIDDKRVSVTYNDALPITQTEKAPKKAPTDN